MHKIVVPSPRGGALHAGEAEPLRARRLAHLAGLAVLLLVAAGSAADLLRAPVTPLDTRSRSEWQTLASAPRLLGTPAHAASAEFILSTLRAAGLEAEAQGTTVTWERRARSITVASVRNIVGRLRGRDSARSVAIAGHYDSVADGPGAGDNAIAVAAMLAAARALALGPPPACDVLFLFTDGEEAGLMGARAFVEQHAWAASVRTVLNFDARGARGPVLMFEVGRGSGGLVPALAGQPVRTNSLMAQMYELLPNDTDFTVFKRRGVAGLNFAFIADANRYHTASDDTAHVDAGLIGDETRLMVSLARRLSEPIPAAGDVVYFSLPGGSLVIYSIASARVLAVVTVVFVAFLLRRFLRLVGGWRDVARGASVAIGALVLVYAVCAGAVALIWRWQAALLDRHGSDLQLGGVVLLGVVGLGVSVWWAVLSWQRSATRRQALQLGFVLVWTIAAMLTAILLPRASFLFVWPALAGGAAAAIGLSTRLPPAIRHTAPIVVGSLGLLLVVPMAIVLVAGVTAAHAAAIATLIVAALGSAAPLEPAWSRSVRFLPLGAAVASMLICGAALLAWGGHPEYTRPAALFLAIDGDTRQAVWATSDAAATHDANVSRRLTAQATRAAMPAFFPGASRRFVASPPMPVSHVPALDVRVAEVAASSASPAASSLTSIEIGTEADRTSLRLEGPIDSVEIAGRRFAAPTAGSAGAWTVDFMGAAARSSTVRVSHGRGTTVNGQVVSTTYQALRAPRGEQGAAGADAAATLVRKGLQFRGQP